MNLIPYEAEPDGQVGAPHHYYQGLGLVFCVAVAESSFWLTVAVVTGFIGFFFCWRVELYPTTGAALSLAGVLLASIVHPLSLSLHSLAVAVGGLVALDDWITHATGVWAPLEHVWRDIIYPRLPSTQ